MTPDQLADSLERDMNGAMEVARGLPEREADAFLRHRYEFLLAGAIDHLRAIGGAK